MNGRPLRRRRVAGRTSDSASALRPPRILCCAVGDGALPPGRPSGRGAPPDTFVVRALLRGRAEYRRASSRVPTSVMVIPPVSKGEGGSGGGPRQRQRGLVSGRLRRPCRPPIRDALGGGGGAEGETRGRCGSRSLGRGCSVRRSPGRLLQHPHRRAASDGRDPRDGGCPRGGGRTRHPPAPPPPASCAERCPSHSAVAQTSFGGPRRNNPPPPPLSLSPPPSAALSHPRSPGLGLT